MPALVADKPLSVLVQLVVVAVLAVATVFAYPGLSRKVANESPTEKSESDSDESSKEGNLARRCSQPASRFKRLFAPRERSAERALFTADRMARRTSLPTMSTHLAGGEHNLRNGLGAPLKA